jgi:2-polyprenyl-3-methyl-5-hydroxy-6-metoxy-1,4-benzoquinol methylase
MPFSDVPLERVREYWDRRPCNIRHSPSPVGTRQYFEEVEARKYFVEPHIPEFAQFEQWKGKKVLEIGCGIGTDTINFARHGAQVTAVDLSEKSLDLARDHVRTFGFQKSVRFLCGNAEELSRFVPVEVYDLVYSFGVIHHTPHPERVLEQIRQYTRPGTMLKIMVYHRRSWKVLGILLADGKGRFWKLQELVSQNSEAQTGCPVTHTYSRRQAQLLLQTSGFTLCDISVQHIFPYRIPDYIQYRYVKELYFRCLPTPLFRAFERKLGWHLCLTARA